MIWIVAGLVLLAATLLIAGNRFSGRTRRPGLFRFGSVTAAAGLTLLWLLPWWVLSADRGDWAIPFFIGSLFIPVSVLGLGLQLMALACGEPMQTRNDWLFEDFIRQNDHPN